MLERRIQHCEFAALSIVFSYFETIAKYHNAWTQVGSRRRFRAGLRLVFPEIDSWDPATRERFCTDMYENVRCGFYHTGMPTGVGLLRTLGDELVYDEERRVVLIEPGLFVARLQNHFAQYAHDLREPTNTEIRNCFRETWDTEYSTR